MCYIYIQHSSYDTSAIASMHRSLSLSLSADSDLDYLGWQVLLIALLLHSSSFAGSLLVPLLFHVIALSLRSSSLLDQYLLLALSLRGAPPFL